MSKMTTELIESLYSFGKKVYTKELSMEEAKSKIMIDYGESIAESSAEFYIGLVKELINGKGSTWNQNSKLLVYYVDHIATEYGVDAGGKAYMAGMRFAKSKSQNGLIDALDELKKKYSFSTGLNSEPDDTKQRFIEWMKGQKRSNGSVYKDRTISRYARALEVLVEQIDGIDLLSTNLFYYTTADTFKVVDKSIRENPNFDTVNSLSKNGNGDLSASMKKYLTFLEEMSANNDNKQSEEGALQGPIGIISFIKRYIRRKGYYYQEGVIEDFYLSLKSKPFVILAGTSGTGKTRLVRLFAEAVGATTSNGRYKMVSVRPDWSDSSDLFGHVDLNGKFIPGDIIDFVKRAEQDPVHPYFLCLDEMNLARVEYYLSDFLSVIETREFRMGKIVTDPLVLGTYYGGDTTAAEKYGTVLFPENLYVVGTVNMDETTFPFSRKVLDRANTIEFSFVDLMPPTESELATTEPLDLENGFLKAEYLVLAQCADQQEAVNAYCVELQKINRVLQQANAHVAYRVRDEIVFYMLNNKKAGLLSDSEAMDNEIMQKILPRIQGSAASVKNMLCDLFEICAGDYEGQNTESELSAKMMKTAQKADCKYPKSAQKIAFMVRRFEEDGFTSYWL